MECCAAVEEGRRSSHVHCACDMNFDCEDDHFAKWHKTMQAAMRELRAKCGVLFT